MRTYILLCIVCAAHLAWAQYQLPTNTNTASEIPATDGNTAGGQPTDATQPTIEAETTITDGQVVQATQGPVVPPMVPPTVPSTTESSPSSESIVTPEELAAAKVLIENIFYMNGPDGIPQCEATKVISDYYSLSVVNCDREQEALLKSGQNPAQCPKACEVGVVHIGSECAVAFNLDYIKNQSAMYGSNFKLEEFDQLGTAALCGVELPEDKKRESYASGQMSFLLNSVGGQLVDCDTQKLLSADFIALKAKCDGTEGELCDPSCQTAIDEITPACVQNLVKATESDQNLYATSIKSFETCLNATPAPTAEAPETATPAVVADVTTAPPVEEDTPNGENEQENSTLPDETDKDGATAVTMSSTMLGLLVALFLVAS